MMYVNYAVTIARKAVKALSRIDEPMRSRLTNAIKGLAEQPRPHGCVKLQGAANAYRVRVNDYRIVYTIDDKVRVVDVVNIAPRGRVYER